MARYSNPIEFDETVATKLRRLRGGKKLSQAAVAVAMRMPPRSVMNHESGRYGHSFFLMCRYAEFYGVQLGHFVTQEHAHG